MANCYVCDRVFLNLQQMRHVFQHAVALNINRDRMDLSKLHRSRFGLEDVNLNAESRVCINCDERIGRVMEFQDDPAAIEFNVVANISRMNCVLCQEFTVQRMTFKARVYFFMKTNLYVHSEARCCHDHLVNDIVDEVLLHQDFKHIPMKVPLEGHKVSRWFSALRNLAQNSVKDLYDNENNFSDSDFHCITGVTKANFQQMFAHCHPVQIELEEPLNNYRRNIKKRHLIALLVKIRQGLSDEFIKTIMNFPSRQSVSSAIDLASKSLEENWATLHVGFNCPMVQNKAEFIQVHNTAFANLLYNPQPDIPRVILYIDCTYFETQKSSNFVVQRQSYSSHKHYNLVKACFLVACDGYIIDVMLPYFSDTRNNDSTILNNALEDEDDNRLLEWLQDGDIFVVDRGYRDSVELLEDLHYNCEIPPFLPRGQRQFTTKEANRARLITKTRWIVEARHGDIKSIFKFFSNVIVIQNVPHLKRFLNIASAIINAFHPPIVMQGFDAETAQEMLHLAAQPNHLQQRLENENLLRRRGQRVNIENMNFQFPRLPVEYLVSKTFGTYQVKLAPAYVQDKQRRLDGGFEAHQIEQNLIRVRIFSRHVQAAQHTCLISYHQQIDENINDPIIGTYCTCKAGAKTLGVCAHVASIIWYLGYGRYPENNPKYPSNRLLTVILDAANRNQENNDP